MKTLMKALVAVSILGAGSALAASPSNGTDATKTLTMTATINSICAIQANATLAFGTYDPTSGTAKDASTAITFKCTKNSIFDIGIDGTVGSRTMTNGTDTLSYELYSNSGRTTAWGNAQDTDTVSADEAADSTGNGFTTGATAQSKTVYGRITAGQDKEAGSYSDTRTITIYY